MVPLIEIKTVPIEIQMKTTSASLEYTRGTAEMEISRSEQGSVDVKSRPIQVQLDTFQPRNASFQSAATNALSQSAQMAQSVSAAQGVPAAQGAAAGPQFSNGAYEATTAYVDQGHIQLNARLGQYAAAPANAAYEVGGANSAAYTPADTAPKTAMNVQWEDGAMQIRYSMDKLNFDWKIDRGEFKFTPGDIEITVAQRPSITFKYTGGPLYVPRSADPNYKPVNVEA